MRRLAVVLVLAAASVAAADVASARDGCGRGMYYNGYRCAPMDGPGPYMDRPGRDMDGMPPIPRNHRYLGNGIIQNMRGELGCLRRGFTVQDGVCKPGRGF